MPRPPAGPATRRALVASLGVGLLATSVVGGTANAEPAAPTGAPSLSSPATPLTAGRYIVTLVDPPAAIYDGGVAGLEATKAPEGEQLDADQPEVEAYSDHLQAEQQDVAASVGAEREQSFTLATNGFAADLTADQAAELVADKGVATVTLEERLQVQTNRTPDFLGLTGPDGTWAAVGGVEAAGKGVVVGIVDSGIWPESASFAGEPLGDAPSATDPYLPYRDGDTIVVPKNDGTDFTGTCQLSQDWTEDLCDTKLVGARVFGDSFLAAVGGEAGIGEDEFVSPRDGSGHGTHTASTAAGNNGVPASIGGRDLGTTSGMAPAATVAAYKICWDAANPAQTGCYTGDTLAAIDAAVEDGVDVINFSVGGSPQTDPADVTSLAFLSAASAGIFVAASAGNSGPGASTLDNSSPWITTVGNSTQEALYGSVVLGNGSEYLGVSSSVTSTVGPAPLVRAQDVALAGAPADVALCPPGSLDPAQTAGTIVVCDRGVYDRVAKSAEVARAGGIGMVLANLVPGTLDADTHSVPTVHVDPPASTAIKDYAATEGATATLEPGNVTDTEIPAPQIAPGSSRGPDLAGEGDILKPDISAPGTGILASVSPPSNNGQSFAYYSGTSMSSPHIAGLAALYFGVHPLWSPMAVKSAMMTTAYDLVRNDGSPNRDPFAAGAGHVDPTRFLNPGLVYDASDADWIGFLEGAGVDTGITDVEAIDPSDLNQASIAVGALTGTQTITRRVTAVTPGLYRATATVPGMQVRVAPSILNFTSAGQTKTFKVTLTRTTAQLGMYTSGFLTWNGGRTTARSPVVVRPVALSAPEEVSGSGAEGSVPVEITPGFTGQLAVTTGGLAAGDVTEDSVATGADRRYVVAVPEGTSLARFDTDSADDGADLDLVVYRLNAAGQPVAVVGVSATEAADERVDLLAPAAGNYLVQVIGYAAAAGGSTTVFTQTNYLVTPATTLGSLTVTPNPVPVQIGRPTTLTVSWSGLDEDTPYLGWLGYEGTDATTIVSIN